MRPRKRRPAHIHIAVLAIAVAAPAWAVSLSTMEEAQPLPAMAMGDTAFVAERLSPGSALLVPLMAAERQASRSTAVDAPAAQTAGAPVVGKPLTDIAFVRVATENGRQQVNAAREALPQLKSSELKRIAERLVSDHHDANARLAQIAQAREWQVPGPSAPIAPPAGSASSDFDGRWAAEMIAGQERSVELYRAQATGGEDKDLRRYARELLPTIEQHLAQLKSLQK